MMLKGVEEKGSFIAFAYETSAAMPLIPPPHPTPATMTAAGTSEWNQAPLS